MLGALWESATLEISTTAGTYRVNLAEAARDDSPPGPLTQLLRPRVRITSGAHVLLDRAPAGPPEEGLPLRPLLFAGGALLAAGALVLILRRL